MDWGRLFRAPDTHEALDFLGGTSSVPWPDGEIVVRGGRRVGRVCRGVPDFILKEWHDGLEAHKLGGWVKGAWDKREERLADATRRLLSDIALEAGPARVDIATGPGGGLVPCVLAIDPTASIMGTDVEIRTVMAWAAHLQSAGIAPNAFFACFDACRMPFADSCLDVVCSYDGFTNIPFHNLALTEAFRVLRPGGLLIMKEEQASGGARDLIELVGGPDVAKAVPGLTGGWTSLLRSLGFYVAREIVGGTRTLDPGESGLAAKAAKMGIRIEVEARSIVARKP